MFDLIDSVVESGIKDGIYPGGTLYIQMGDEIVYSKAYGNRALKPDVIPNELDTIYDLASLSKVVATTTAIMVLFSQGKITLQDKIGPLLNVTDSKKDLTIYQLLTHTSGMEPETFAWKKIAEQELMDEILRIEPVAAPNTEVVYSCLNFILLMKIVENVSGMKFDVFCKEKIFLPLGMNNTGFLPKDISRVAPTCERDGATLLGKPDDETAYYLGGVSGNAGVFSTGEDLCKLLNGLNNGTIFPKKVFKKFISETLTINGMSRHLGWDAPCMVSSAGDLLDERSYGHTGFTGNSIWVDKTTDTRVIFLTNRTHLERRSTIPAMQVIRRKLHNIIFSRLG